VPELPDLSDPRYLDEIGWFLYHDRYERDQFEGSFDDERLAYSKVLYDHILGFCGVDDAFFAERTVAVIGCGCTSELAAWPAKAKIGVDPLVYAYQQLGMMLREPGTPTIYLNAGAEDIPILDDCADFTLCRNMLDHLPDPGRALAEITRITAPEGLVYISVDLGGTPTPDEPTVFSRESLNELVEAHLDVVKIEEQPKAHSMHRDAKVEVLGHPATKSQSGLDRDAVLQAYESRVGDERGS
jgi:SAM-dependent methyltransferase